MVKVNYCFEDIVDSLKACGIQIGDTIFLHSNIGFFGRMADVNNAEELCRNFMEAIQKAIGKEGTLVVPTFSYSFCHGELYNPFETPSDCGMFSEYVRKQNGVIRSLDPNFSIAAVGRLADYYTENPVHESFGESSFWERFLTKAGKIVCMNMDCGSTFVHYIENRNQVSYRYNKAFNGILKDYEGVARKDYFVHYVYDLDKPEDGPYFVRLNQKCHEANICKVSNLGKGTLLAMNSTEYYDFISETLKKEPRFLTIGG